jgi:sigma-B regulation protein RsbU (phosphoserine phosphatase)
VRRGVGLWLGFLLALPIPILALSSTSPSWIVVVSLTAPPVWALIVGAAGRVAYLSDVERERISVRADAAEDAHGEERAVLRGEAASQKAGRERAEAVERCSNAELHLAQRVNRSLLPEDIVREDVTVVVRQIPCAFVGGDYLHAAFPSPRLLYLCVGDVSGHGLSAALVVSRIHGLVQRMVLEETAPEEFIGRLGETTVGILRHTDMFMTFAVFRVDLAARRIEYATAGHPAQFLLRTDGRVESLQTRNPLLGMFARDPLDPVKAASVAYAAGDELILFTDGLFEVAAEVGGAMLGESGIRAGLPALADGMPAAVATEILRSATAFGKAGPFEDDVSLMVARFGPPHGGDGPR